MTDEDSGALCKLPRIVKSDTSVTIGTCSICGGRVSIPKGWLGINEPEPVPSCGTCGAVATGAHGPVVSMMKPRAEDCGRTDDAYNGGWPTRGG